MFDPADRKRSHESWIGISSNEVVAIGAVAPHSTDSLCLGSGYDLLYHIGADKVGELFDYLNKLSPDKLAPVRIIGALCCVSASNRACQVSDDNAYIYLWRIKWRIWRGVWLLRKR